MKTVKLRNLKGSFDYLPKEQIVRSYITDILKKIFEKYGYQPVDTPIVCYYDVLASKYGGGSEILKEVYKLKDQGDRELALRYDLTVPFARLVAMTKDLQLPFKRYEIGKVFRDGPVKVGRNREFIQCDADVIGIKSMMIEAEFMNLFVDAFKELEIDVYIEYNNRKLMSGMILEVGIDKDRVNETITIVDKFKKMSKEELVKEFSHLEIDAEKIEMLTKYFSLNFEQIKEQFAGTNNTVILEGISELEELNSYLNFLGINEYMSFSSTLARGHDIYTGTVFEVYTKDGIVKSSIAAGGRFDKIITNFIDDGSEYPAVGISFGLDVIYEVIKSRFVQNNMIDILIIPMDTKKESLALANNLRKFDLKVDLIFNDRKLGKVMNYANREKIPYVIIIGESEIENNKFKLKEMETGSEYEFSFDEAKKIYDRIIFYNK